MAIEEVEKLILSSPMINSLSLESETTPSITHDSSILTELARRSLVLAMVSDLSPIAISSVLTSEMETSADLNSDITPILSARSRIK